MRRKQILKVVNTLLAILFLDMAATGLFSDRIPYDLYQIVHAQAGKFFVLLAVAHLALNWNWVKLTYLKKKRK